MSRNISLLAIFAFLVFACDTNDDGFYNELHIESANLVEIEIQPGYTVDDVLYVEALIPRLVQEIGKPNLLDIRQTTKNAESFNFTYMLEKKLSDGTWQYVELGNRFVADQGTATSGSFISAVATYDSGLEQYYFRGGIRLTEAGEHRLSFGYNSISLDKVELRSESTGQNLRLNIASTADNLDGNGNYNFIVN